MAQTFTETKDPNEVKDYVFDWSERLGADTISGSTVTAVDAAGTTLGTTSFDDTTSTLWLSGGTNGGKAIYTIRITTAGGRTLENSVAVLIVDTAIESETASIDGLKADLASLLAARLALAKGERVDEVWRDGRRLVTGRVTLDGLNSLIRTYQQDIATMQNELDGSPRRSAIGIVWG